MAFCFGALCDILWLGGLENYLEVDNDMECNLEGNLTQCACTYEPCSRKGKCCECIRYHWRMKQLPGCLFPPDAERTYDRSVEHFIRIYSRR